jgi:tetratricopeptide (TPR) repeat protein
VTQLHRRRKRDYDERGRGRSDLVAASTAGRLVTLAHPQRALGDVAVAGATAAALIAFAGTNGGYFPTSWGWSALGFAWAAALALVVRARPAIGRLELAFIGLFAAYAGWVALSLLWTRNVSQTVGEVQRDLVYPLGLLALALIAHRPDVRRLLGAIVVAITAITAYALATRLFPDRLGSFESADTIAAYRLETPVGYWNALGVFAVLGILLAVGFVAHGRSVLARAAAAATLPVLASALYFTFSRGSWLALAVGTFVLVAVESRRLRLITSLLVGAPPAVAVVLLASQADGQTRSGATLAEATRDGHRIALWVVLLAGLSFALVAALALFERRVHLPRTVRLAYGAALVAALLVGLGAVFESYGWPPTLVRKAYDSFKAPPIGVRPSQSYNVRLFTLSSNGRIESWKVAWQNYEDHQALGSGAGTYEESWYALRAPNQGKIRDAHGLYIEALSELGPVGLALLSAGLALPFVGAVRARSRRLVPAATAAYVAFVLHAGGDWDWEMTALTLTGLFIGAALLAARPEPGAVRVRRPGARYATVAALLGISAFALVGVLGSAPLASAETAFENGRYTEAAEDARRAIRWTPWGAQPWHMLGQTQVAQRRFPEARKSLLTALERAPNDWSIWFALGTASTGRAAACAYFQAGRLNPHDPNIQLLRRRGDLPRARPSGCRAGAG